MQLTFRNSLASFFSKITIAITLNFNWPKLFIIETLIFKRQFFFCLGLNFFRILNPFLYQFLKWLSTFVFCLSREGILFLELSYAGFLCLVRCCEHLVPISYRFHANLHFTRKKNGKTCTQGSKLYLEISTRIWSILNCFFVTLSLYFLINLTSVYDTALLFKYLLP